MSPEINRNILVAVDASENSQRAVHYVGNMLGGVDGFKVTLLHVIREPEEDEFPDQAEKEKWYREHRREVDRMLEEYRGMLVGSGFAEADVSVRSSCGIVPPWRNASWRNGILWNTPPLWWVDAGFP